MAPITSKHNPLLREVRKAVERGSLTADGLCVAEGFHLLDEARRSPCEIVKVLAAESVADRIPHEALVRVTDDALASVAATETTQGVITLVRPCAFERESLFAGLPLLLVLDGIQDPGNAGTLLRTAEAFGVTGVLLTRGTVNVWNPKTVRASAGSVFRLPLHTAASAEELAGQRLHVYATVPSSGRAPEGVDLAAPAAIVVGSEARGVSEAWVAAARPVTVPTRTVESLNAAVAGAIVLYEAFRQRASL